MWMYQGRLLACVAGNLDLKFMYSKFCFDATPLFKIWTPAWSFATTSRFHWRFFFFSWQNGTLYFLLGPVFLFLFFLTRDFLLLLIFSMSKDFSISNELSFVNFVKCAMLTKCANRMKKRWAIAVKILLGESPWYEIITPSWFINFYSKLPFPKCLKSVKSNKRKNDFSGLWSRN